METTLVEFLLRKKKDGDDDWFVCGFRSFLVCAMLAQVTYFLRQKFPHLFPSELYSAVESGSLLVLNGFCQPLTHSMFHGTGRQRMFWNVDGRILEHKPRPGQCSGRKKIKTKRFSCFFYLFFLNGQLKRLNMNRLVAWPLLADIRTPVFTPLAGIFLLAAIFFLAFCFWSLFPYKWWGQPEPTRLGEGGEWVGVLLSVILYSSKTSGAHTP